MSKQTMWEKAVEWVHTNTRGALTIMLIAIGTAIVELAILIQHLICTT